jgi:hypothetical protein
MSHPGPEPVLLDLGHCCIEAQHTPQLKGGEIKLLFLPGQLWPKYRQCSGFDDRHQYDAGLWPWAAPVAAVVLGPGATDSS